MGERRRTTDNHTQVERELALAKRIASGVAALSGHTYFVGGYVRDIFLKGIESSGADIDIEVHGITPHQLEGVLDSLGQRIFTGESFGVYSLKGYSLDIAMPRKEEAKGKGHRDFYVDVDPFIGTLKGAQRRDFTMNALMMDVLSGQIIDHFGGRRDIENRIIRHVDERAFPEDALRVLRGAQFAARFEFDVAPETFELFRTMDLGGISKQRVQDELKKALLLSKKPSIFFKVLRSAEKLSEWFGEVSSLVGIEQNPLHHAEGDVWNHTMMVLDEAVFYAAKTLKPFGFMLSALTHDFGKIICTERINGQIHAYSHETLGLPLVKGFLERLTEETKLIEYVLNLVEYHMKPNTLAADNSSIKSTNRLFDASLDPEGLIYLAVSDSLGKSAPRPYVSHEDFLFRRLEIYREYMARPYVSGRDLIASGLKAGNDFSLLLEYAHKLRLAGVEKNSALKQTLAYARSIGVAKK